ncbi:MAG: hypothetical protein BGO31_05875 [Bacteroidetes bacterium 43-16]|nr:MAG: hypothetical protein BGO31_05875 [Bacteroidetes bacterium 43-16]
MFSIFKKNKKINVNFSSFLNQDMHSHILPGIDDGAPDTDTAIALIRGMMSSGITKFMGTPHIMAEIHRNTRASITDAYEKLRKALTENNIDIDLKYAAEYMIDEGFLDHLKKGDLLTVFDNKILVETPFYHEPIDIEDVLFQIDTAGYKAILAHPERYHFIDDKLKVLDKYLDRDIALQLNILSLSGYYGSREKENAHKILDAGLYRFVGSDLHHTRHLNRIATMVLDRKVIDKLEKLAWENQQITDFAPSV